MERYMEAGLGLIELCNSKGLGVSESIVALDFAANLIRRARVERNKKRPDTPLDEKYLKEIKHYVSHSCSSSNETSSSESSKSGNDLK